jgi:hypothetical protein
VCPGRFYGASSGPSRPSLEAANHITENRTWREGGKDTLMVSRFTRKTK